jgi:pimeloyl-ACP methyl ester carboxylesterase
MSSNPTSNFVILPNRPIVQENGEITQGPIKIHYWEWKGHLPIILFCHAASFHGRSYDHIINDALHGFHVIALDYRGHGRSQQHPPPYHFRWFGEDVLQFIEILNLPTNNLIGIGHSMGGYVLICAAAIALKRLFRSLLLFDPAVFSPSYYGIHDKRLDALEYIRRRKNQWSSIEDMISRLEKREPFSRWPKHIIRNYCTYALDENYKLILTPEAEHSMYVSSFRTDSSVYSLIEQSKFIQDITVNIIRTPIPFSIGQFDTSPTSPDLLNWFKKGRDTQLENFKHFFPMEQPQLMIDFINQHMKEDLRSSL